MRNRQTLCIAGESGMGIDSSGEIWLHAMMDLGYWVSADRQFPSLIKGGASQYIISVAGSQIYSVDQAIQLGVGLGKSGLKYCLEEIQPGGVIVHNFAKRKEAFPTLLDDVTEKGQRVEYVPTRQICDDHRVGYMFENTVMLGALARAYGLHFETIESALKHRYGKKENIWETNQKMLKAGYDRIRMTLIKLPSLTESTLPSDKRMLIDGNTALALGAIHAGVRTYFAYPMSPSTSVLLYLAKVAEKTGMLVKQVEDEITAIQMNIGASYAGSRAFTCTSGGGFDLMTESISLSAMIEVPCVVGIAQRPGPATGLPTWTAQGDLNLAIHAGHGEFARIVVAVSDAQSSFSLMQLAYDFADQFQVPVIVLTEKVIADNRSSVPVFDQDTTPLKRGLITDLKELETLSRDQRYKITDSGVSPRWLPTSSTTTYFANGDEHKEDGTLDESPDTAHMIAKRIRKLDSIKKILPHVTVYGSKTAHIGFIGRGSTKSAMLDCIAGGDDIAYCHVEWLWPLRKEELSAFMSQFTHICVAENNATGQLANVIQQEFAMSMKHRLLKWNGRHIQCEDIRQYCKEHTF